MHYGHFLMQLATPLTGPQKTVPLSQQRKLGAKSLQYVHTASCCSCWDKESKPEH